MKVFRNWLHVLVFFMTFSHLYGLESDQPIRSCLSKNVLSLLFDTMKMKVKVLDQWPADVSFLCADLKYTGKVIKICEFGGMLSSIKDTSIIINGKKETVTTPYWEIFWHYLAQFKKPIWYVGKQQERIIKELSCVGGESFASLHDFSLYWKKNFSHAGHSKKKKTIEKLHDYEGILVINQRIKLEEIKAFLKECPQVLLVNGNTKIFTKKSHSFRLFNEHDELKNFIPGWKEYKKKYTPDLAQTIINDIPADFYIIKPMSAVQSKGVLMIAKEDLDLYLKYILHQIDELKTPYDENLLYWKTDRYQSFYVQEYVPSKDSMIQGKRYDPTMRLFFFLNYDQGHMKIDVIAGYWKIPFKSLDEPGTLMEKHISHSLLGRAYTGILVEPKDLTHAKALIRDMLPAIYEKMLEYVHTTSRKRVRLETVENNEEEWW